MPCADGVVIRIFLLKGEIIIITDFGTSHRKVAFFMPKKEPLQKQQLFVVYGNFSKKNYRRSKSIAVEIRPFSVLPRRIVT